MSWSFSTRKDFFKPMLNSVILFICKKKKKKLEFFLFGLKQKLIFLAFCFFSQTLVCNLDPCWSANRELKHPAFLLSRKPTGTKLSCSRCSVPEHFMRSWRSSRRTTSRCLPPCLPPCWSVRTAKFFFLIKGMASSTEQIVNKSF